MALSDVIKQLLGARVTGRQVNRGALLAYPKEPFVRWVAEVSGCSVEQARELASSERSAYLLPMSFEPKPDSAVLKAAWRYIFEHELGEWSLDKRTWPENRTRNLFSQWFTISWSDEVLDLCREDLTRDMEPRGF